MSGGFPFVNNLWIDSGTTLSPYNNRACSITIPDAGNVVGLTITQNDTTNNPKAVSIVNTGTGNGVFIDQNGAGTALNIDYDGAGSVNVVSIYSNSTYRALYVEAEASIANDYCAAEIYSNVAQTGTGGGGLNALVRITSDNASSTAVLCRFRNDGTGDNLLLDQDGNGIALHIDNDGTANSITIEGTTVTDFIVTKAGNVGIGTATFGANSVSVFSIVNGTAPAAAVANQIQIYSADTTDTTATLALMLEQAVEEIGTFTPSHKFKIFVNGIAYWFQLDAV